MATAFIAEDVEYETVLPERRRDALSSGIIFYFNGKPCPKGHVAKRYASSGICKECLTAHDKRWKIEHREKLAKKRVERYWDNPDAARAKSREWASANPGKRAEQAKNYRKNNRDTVLAAKKAWKKANPDKVREMSARAYQKRKPAHAAAAKAWSIANRERKVAADRAWREANRERKAANDKQWRAANRERVRQYGTYRNYRAKKRKADGSHTRVDVAKIRKAQKDKCAICRVDLKRRGHVDHIVAISNGGSNWPSNLQLLCETCNKRKADKVPEDFMRSMGFLI